MPSTMTYNARGFRSGDPMSREEADGKWSCLHRDFKTVLQSPYECNIANIAYEARYRDAYSLVLHKFGDLVYTGLIDLINKHLATVAEQLAIVDVVECFEDPFQEMLRLWHRHMKSMTCIRDILKYVEKEYILDKHKVSIHGIGRKCFLQSELCDATRIKLSGYVAAKFCALGSHSSHGLDASLVAYILAMLELGELCKLRGVCHTPKGQWPASRQRASRHHSDDAREVVPSIPETAYCEPVVQEVPQEEPGAIISPTEAAQVVQEQWAQSVVLLASHAAEAASFEEVDASVVSSPSSKAVLPDTPECLLDKAIVLTNKGPVPVADLMPGSTLTSGRPGHEAVVCSARKLDPALRNMVTLHLASSAPLVHKVTASHGVRVLRPGRNSFESLLASEVQKGDRMRTLAEDCVVELVEPSVEMLAVVEVRLHDTKGTFFVGMPNMDLRQFVEVFGSMAPVGMSRVELLHFQRWDRFREIICENTELADCHHELEDAGFCIDLGLCGLGSGKLLVRAGLAAQTIEALRRRMVDKGQLTSSDVVVSSELKPILLEQVNLRAPRKNLVRWSEVLDLGSRVKTVRTFVDFTDSSSRSAIATCSSTDAHAAQNPRKRPREVLL